jgi:hypothetical protein
MPQKKSKTTVKAIDEAKKGFAEIGAEFQQVAKDIAKALKPDLVEYPVLKTKLTKPLIERILVGLAMGLPEGVAWQAAGIDSKEHWRIKKLAEKDENWTALIQACDMAIALGITILHTRIIEEDSRSAGAKWVLSRRFRSDYGDKVVQDINVSQRTTPLEILTDEELKGLLEAE